MDKQKVNCAKGTRKTGLGHALLSASSSHKWLNCPPSARLCEQYDDTGSSYAAEGTDAHTLCEYKLQTALGIPTKDPTSDLTYYNKEMDDCATGYATFILEILETAKQRCSDPGVLVEQRLDFSKYVQDGFGTGDCIVIADGLLHIVDYKHGQGLLVEAENNSQIFLYALGTLELFDGIYDIETVSMTIYQPRRENVSTYTISKEALYKWANDILKPTAELAFAGEGEFSCGEWCRFCKAKHECRARADCNMELARYEFKLPPLLEDDEVEDILKKIDGLIAWATDIKDYAFQSALSGTAWNDFKLVEGRSNRKYADESQVASIVSAAGFDPYEHKVLGITAMTSLLGKKRFEEILGSYIEKPKGKPTLVPKSDNRPAIQTAGDDFNEI